MLTLLPMVVKVTVSFSLQPGASGLALNTSAKCPSVVLDVYCRRAQLLGFEVQVSGADHGGAVDATNLTWQVRLTVGCFLRWLLNY